MSWIKIDSHLKQCYPGQIPMVQALTGYKQPKLFSEMIWEAANRKSAIQFALVKTETAINFMTPHVSIYSFIRCYSHFIVDMKSSVKGLPQRGTQRTTVMTWW